MSVADYVIVTPLVQYENLNEICIEIVDVECILIISKSWSIYFLNRFVFVLVIVYLYRTDVYM